MAVALISHAASVHQPWSAKVYTLASDLFPKSAVASVTALGGFMGGVLFTALLPGYLVTHSGDGPVFVIMGSGHLVGFACGHFVLGKMQRLVQ
jgi:ACS family hexuronate transporter-like MFS transporter